MQGKKKGRPPTREQLKILASAPYDDQAVVIIAGAYAELVTCSPLIVLPKGIMRGPIPWTAMDQWCRRHRLAFDVGNLVIRTLGIVDKIMRKRIVDAIKARK